MGNTNEFLELSPIQRESLFQKTLQLIEKYHKEVNNLPLSPRTDSQTVRNFLEAIDFSKPKSPEEVLNFVAEGFEKYHLHTANSRYFGVFNPKSTTMSVVADALVAAINPQLASWTSSPFAVELEQKLIEEFGAKFGYPKAMVQGSFTSGGNEANHIAIVAALVSRFPKFSENGLASLKARPTLYVSTECHHSFIKAARLCGLGTSSVREVAVDATMRMNGGQLSTQITRDISEGFDPFLIVGTAGTTSSGTIDYLESLAQVAQQESIWFHVDAAWGGAVSLMPDLKYLLSGIERADSITFDAHKWLSVSMGAGLFLTRRRGILDQAFHVETSYMPPESSKSDLGQPYAQSMQWSRRHMGLKLYMSLAVASWSGYADVLRHQCKMGLLLKSLLIRDGWLVLNETPLPVLCFVDGTTKTGRTEEFVLSIAKRVASDGRAWVTTTRLNKTMPVLRAGISNFTTEEKDVKELVEILSQARRAYYQSPAAFQKIDGQIGPSL